MTMIVVVANGISNDVSRNCKQEMWRNNDEQKARMSSSIRVFFLASAARRARAGDGDGRNRRQTHSFSGTSERVKYSAE